LTALVDSPHHKRRASNRVSSRKNTGNRTHVSAICLDVAARVELNT
jgi:hypothetical protein